MRARLAKLRATDLRDHDAAWEATLDVLAWLYRCHEAEKKHVEKQDGHCREFFADRDSSDSGRTLAAIMWIRGQVDHHQAEIKAMVWVPVTWGAEPVTWNGEPVMWGEERFEWPPREKLPQPVDKKRGRDRYYEQFVQGAGLFEPLERAFGWLAER